MPNVTIKIMITLPMKRFLYITETKISNDKLEVNLERSVLMVDVESQREVREEKKSSVEAVEFYVDDL